MMGRFFAATAISWAVLHVAFLKAAACPDGFLGYAGSCYHFSHDAEQWADAVTICDKVYGARLVEINDRSENTFLLNEANRLNHDYWTSGNDLQVEGEWRWLSSGEAVTFSSWQSGEPSNSNGNENCLEINHAHWNDDICDKPQLYICEATLEELEVVG